MKAFFVGLVFLLLVSLFSGVLVILYPFFVLLHFFLRFLLLGFLVVFFIWLLGKLVILLWEHIRK